MGRGIRRAWVPVGLAALGACSEPPEEGLIAGDAGAPNAAASPDADAPDRGSADADGRTVRTSAGVVEGVRGEGFLEFLGIPYAEPPVGALRFAPPSALRAFPDGVVRSSRAPACVQRNAVGAEVGDEDCLVVNVHTPDPPPVNAPVMVWIHGGGLVSGEPLQLDGGTRGDVLARDLGVVVVSMAYRLGALGYLAHPALAAAGSGEQSGNYGLLDQLLALEWVAREIGAFGGDPANVTLFGESAGATSVCALLSMPAAQGLLARAVMQSGGCPEAATREEAEAQGVRFVEALGCAEDADVAACLRGASVAAIREALPFARVTLLRGPDDPRWAPHVDGRTLPRDPAAAAAAGELIRAPTLAGWNLDEGSLFVRNYESLVEPVTSAEQVLALVQSASASLGTTAAATQALLDRYLPEAESDPRGALMAALTDATVCQLRQSYAHIARTGAPAYRYVFARREAPFQLPTTFPLGAYHGAEIQYVFGHPAQPGLDAFLGDERALHQTISGYWARFARVGDPNQSQAAPWTRWTSADEAFVTLDVPVVPGTGAGTAQCAYLEGPKP